MIKIDRHIFFREYRKFFGSIKKQRTVDEINSMLDFYEKEQNNYNISIYHLAYIFATAYHETAHDFIPKREYGSTSYFIRKYWLNTRVAKWLGNDSAEEAVKYCGRGKVQITGETNYEKYGIENNPEKAIETEFSTYILFDGIMKGIFTGKKLATYINGNFRDYYNARRVINGLDKANLIAGYARNFEKIITKSII